MGKQNDTFLDGQLDLFSTVEDVVPLLVVEEVKEVIQVENSTEEKSLQEEVLYRQFASVQIGERVQVSSPIDTSPEAIGYFDYHKGRKGTVMKVVENSKPFNGNYQFYATILFENGEEGVFYDLELIVIE